MGAKASFLSTANSQPNGSGGAKYQDWYGISRNVSWCAAFVCYVANKSGCGNIVPKTANLFFEAFDNFLLLHQLFPLCIQ